MTLTTAQRDHYWDHGYVVLPQLFAADLLQAFNERFCKLVLDESARSETMVLMRDVMIAKGAVQPASPLHAINKLMNFEGDPVLDGFTFHGPLLAVVRALLGEAIYSVSTNVFNKPPNVDGRHPMHQDLRYFRFRPADGVVGVWTALLPASRETGCLAVLPGSHRGGLLTHGTPEWEYVNRGFFSVDIDREARVHVELSPGDTLLFHPLLVHGSGRNRSAQFRRAVSTHFVSAGCESPGRDWRIGTQARRI